MKVAADPEQVVGTILDGRDYSSGQLPQENIRIIKEADATLRLNLGTQLDALYDRPHKEITNEGGTLIMAYRNFCGAYNRGPALWEQACRPVIFVAWKMMRPRWWAGELRPVCWTLLIRIQP